MAARAEGLRGVDEVTSARLLVREFVVFSARNPQLHRVIAQESKADRRRRTSLFVLAPECRRRTGVDPFDDDVVEAHADAVCTLLFGPDPDTRPA
ncbi:MAG TPA: hypothetical protein VIL36_06255 [Acidimicrobiales bacterium]